MNARRGQEFNRREFLKLSALIGLGAATVTVLPPAESVAFDRHLYKVNKAKVSMGTFVNVTVLHPSPGLAEEACERALAEMERVRSLLDRYQASSAIGVLNRDGALAGLPPGVMAVLRRARHFYFATGGAFDVTVRPLVDLYRESFARTGRPPAAVAVNHALKLVDGGKLILGADSARLAGEEMSITLDGIAKGYVLDCGAAALKRCGIEHGLINAGGDIRVVGGKGKRRPWLVAVQNPDKGQPPVAVVELAEGALATSGNYEIYFDHERLSHHIINPDTGHSPVGAASTTVRAPVAMDADALATAVFVLGPQAGPELVERLPGVECLVVNRQGRKVSSRGWVEV